VQLIFALWGCGQAPPPPGRLLWVSERDAPTTVMAALGPEPRDEQALSAVPGHAFPGPPDPQGADALIVGVEDGPQGHRETLWRVPLDGSAPVRLAPPAGVIRNPAWAPDGSFVVFEADPFSYRDLFRAERAGSAMPQRLTAEHGGSFEPAVSPDGQLVAFGTSRDGNAEIYVMKADGSSPSRKTDHIRDDVRPAWPDADTLAWITHRDGQPGVYLMKADGSEPHALRPARGGIDLDHSWTPDGARVAVTVQSGPSEVGIEIYDRSGTLLAELDAPGVDEHPAWSPDGAWLAFTSSREGQPDVYVVRADGTDLRRITSDPAPEWLPRWSR
jgi:TolB protein